MNPQSRSEVIRSLECDPERKREMLSSFRQRLDTDTQGQDAIARLLWLFSHVEEYLDRWLCCVTLFSMRDFLHNDLHVILLIAVDLIDEEHRSLAGFDAFKEKWQTFASTVREIREETD